MRPTWRSLRRPSGNCRRRDARIPIYWRISLTSTEASRPVPAALGLFSGASQFEAPNGPIAAAAVIVTIPVVVLVLLFQRRIVAGLTNGAVKG